ncbi:hypothetical protein Ancab_033605 [Ancistrocladus abbreviatus]
MPDKIHANTADSKQKKDSSSGMSSGKKVGIMLGVLVGIEVVKVGSFVRKKYRENMQRAQYGGLLLGRGSIRKGDRVEGDTREEEGKEREDIRIQNHYLAIGKWQPDVDPDSAVVESLAEYEGLNMVCFDCEHHGHHTDGCPLKEVAAKGVQEDNVVFPSATSPPLVAKIEAL